MNLKLKQIEQRILREYNAAVNGLTLAEESEVIESVIVTLQAKEQCIDEEMGDTE